MAYRILLANVNAAFTLAPDPSGSDVPLRYLLAGVLQIPYHHCPGLSPTACHRHPATHLPRADQGQA